MSESRRRRTQVASEVPAATAATDSLAAEVLRATTRGGRSPARVKLQRTEATDTDVHVALVLDPPATSKQSAACALTVEPSAYSTTTPSYSSASPVSSSPIPPAASPVRLPSLMSNASLNTNLGRQIIARDADGVRLLYLTSKVLALQSVSNVDQCFTVDLIIVAKWIDETLIGANPKYANRYDSLLLVFDLHWESAFHRCNYSRSISSTYGT